MPRALHRIEYEYFRVLLQEAVEASGLTQMQFAEQLGKPQSFVSKSIRGERRVDMSEFLEIADAMNLNVMDFLAEYRARLKRLKMPSRSGARTK